MSTTEVKQPILAKTPYDISKDVVTIYIPALAAFYSGLTLLIPELPYGTQVVGVLGLLALFLGSVLKVSSNQHAKVAEVEKREEIRATVDNLVDPSSFDGQLVVNHSDALADNFRVAVDSTWDELGQKDYIILKVEDQTTQHGK